jgi:signal transduction histidine kinase
VTPRELRAIVEAGDAKAICAVARACGKALTGDDLGLDRAACGEALMPLVDHPSGEVRQAVAEIADALEPAHLDRIVERLANDADRYVRNAATATAARSAARKRTREKGEREEQQLQGVLDEIQSKDGKGARRRAEAAVRRGVELFVRRLEHELNKTEGSTTRALLALHAELAKPDASLALARRHATTLDEQVDFRRAILKRAREYATQTKPAFAAEPVGALLDEARRQLVDRLGERASRLRLVVDIDSEIVAEVDRHAMLQALQNVLQNAVEAYPIERAEHPLRMGARTLRAKSQLEIRVADEGAGISSDERERLFVPFGSTKPGGTGVGMLIVRTMIEDVHGGELAIESEPGVGTTVTMVVPMKQRGGASSR